MQRFVVPLVPLPTFFKIRSAVSMVFGAFFLATFLDPSITEAQVEFRSQVAPLLASRCLECHAGENPKGKLDLTSPESLSLGGDSGETLIGDKLDGSLLWSRVESDEMPPEHPLNAAEKSILRKWIQGGGKWIGPSIDRFAYSTDSRAGRDWWSLQPVGDINPPALSDKFSVDWEAATWAVNEIDQFVARKLIENKLQPSPRSSPRSLVRRVYFDLIGLPPAPSVVERFEKNPSEVAYQEIVSGLLQSDHYGERWGRHWLDVVRFGESDGFERNNPRKNSWPYRDWVIKALNDDMPYDEFVRLQLIGDQVKGGIEGAAATGFWVAGVHNTVVGGSKRMKLLARQDQIEEVLATVGQTFVGLTVNCARCHDHKFDPITQKEFYRMASAISGLGYGEKTEVSAVDTKAVQSIEKELAKIQEQLKTLEDQARQEIMAARKKGTVETPVPPKPFAKWDFDSDLHDSVSGLKGRAVGNARIEGGALVLDGNSFVETMPVKLMVKEKTLEVLVQLDNLEQRGGGVISIETLGGTVFDSIVYGEREAGHWMAGSNGFARTDSFQAVSESQAVQKPVLVSIVYQADGTIIGYRNGKQYGTAIGKSGLQTFQPGNSEFIFGLRHKPGGAGRSLKGKIYSAAFYDRALSPSEIAAIAGDPSKYVPEEQIVKWLSPDARVTREKLKRQSTRLNAERSSLVARANQKIYTLRAGGGATTHVLLRGDPENVGELVSPGAVAAVNGVSGDFNLPPNAPDTLRRGKLATWITHADNPLFSRVLVNRVWHYHFGIGIVDTPNDLGFNGGRPTHPDLLDWLAGNFKKNGLHLKGLHRLIVSSATYRQSGYPDENHLAKMSIDPRQVDVGNRLFWRMNPRRLEAESIRDAMLAVAGKLNRQMGGPSFEDVSIIGNNGTTYYSPIDVDGPQYFRRTVYRFNPRGGRSALLDTFDCPDSAATAPRRAVTTTPLQALSLLNNSFVLKMSDYFAERVQTEAGKDSVGQVVLAWRLALGRVPRAAEEKMAIEFVEKHGMNALCRALFNVSEFVAIE